MSFVRGLSNTATSARDQSREQAVAAFVDKFKDKCERRSRDGFFSAQEVYHFNIGKASAARDHEPLRLGRFAAPRSLKTLGPTCFCKRDEIVNVNQCVAEGKAEFKKRAAEPKTRNKEGKNMRYRRSTRHGCAVACFFWASNDACV